MAVIGKWTGGTTTLLPGTGWTSPNGLFATEERNDGSAYGFSSSASSITLPASDLANGYLIIGLFEIEDTSNGRVNPSARFSRTTGTGNFVTSQSSGYSRDNSEDRSYCFAWAFVDNPSAASVFAFQWKRDTDVPAGGTVRSTLQVIPLFYSQVGIFQSNSTACPGNTTPSQITGFTAIQEPSNITLSSNVVTLSGQNKNYLCLGSYFWENIGTSRTQRWGGFTVDGTFDNSKKGYSYARNASNANIGEMFTGIVSTTTTARTLEASVYRGDGVANGQGGANVTGNTTGANPVHNIVVLELNDGTEFFEAVTSTQSANIASTGATDINVAEQVNSISPAAFSKNSDSQIQAEKNQDVLSGFNISCASFNVGSGQRYTGFGEYTINGTEDTTLFSGEYLRNNQGTQDTFGWSTNAIAALPMLENDLLGASITELPGSEGGGGNVAAPSGWVGFWGVNLDSMEPAPTPTFSAYWAEGVNVMS